MTTTLAASADPIVHSDNPYNAKPPLERLRANFVTAQDDFYVRCHGTVPVLDATTVSLEIAGLVAKPAMLSMAELRARFPEFSEQAVMQCAGNRRADMREVRPVKGDPWAPGAIGNARWTGVRLADVLRAAGAETGANLHVAFSCHDPCSIDGAHFRYGVSIPMPKALSPEVLLVYAMNDEPLQSKHGFPLRVVVPGFAGVRSAKWLERIEVRDRPSDSPIQATDYKLLPPDIQDEDAIDWSRGTTINDLPVNSAICDPTPHARLNAGTIAARGYAMASNRAIVRVDVSSDGGRSWIQARLESNPRSLWSWTFWEATLDLTAGEHQLVVRAWDEAGQTQPSSPDDTWNIKGYLSAAWHRVPVTAA